MICLHGDSRFCLVGNINYHFMGVPWAVTHLFGKDPNVTRCSEILYNLNKSVPTLEFIFIVPLHSTDGFTA